MAKLILLLTLLTIIVSVSAWKTCSETFCETIRCTAEGYNKYVLNIQQLVNKKNYIEGIFNNNDKELQFKLATLKGSTFHLVINEIGSTRYRENNVLLPLEAADLLLVKNQTTAVVSFEDAKAIITGNPFKIEFYNKNKLVSIVNEKNRMVYDINNFNIAIDVSFPQAQRAYGLPQHAEHLSLRNTAAMEPYRLFNLDYAGYAIKSTEALYGSVGVLYAHALTHSSGIFWFNTAQTWIDINTIPNELDTYFMSESGSIEMFILTGPTLAKSVQQYAKLTGKAHLPQYFSLGYHQSRYSYMTQEEVIEVVDQFDKINLPVDSLWLDIDYTDEKKYFTWHPKNFRDPLKLQATLLNRHRVLVTIIDPHIKVEDGYPVHDMATLERYYVQNEDGTDYVGKCWPGNSSYLDFMNPKALNYYASLYNTMNTFSGSNVHVWNDMNEPSVFDNPKHENTMTPTSLHYKKVQHKDVHNVYGMYQVIGTHKGMMGRTVKQRPFILTRSHFAGIQRYAAIWTGDNQATFDYLRISFPMCLTAALAGISFCGADVAGFQKVPTDELYQRWYQAGAWLPFYRAHSEITSPRREPYLYPESVQNRVRTALEQRYAHLPVWYTAFREHELTGEPVIRPIIYQYPNEGDALNIDDQVFIGKNILAAPILKEGVSTTNVYLPGGASQNWFNIDNNFKMYNGTGFSTLPVTLNSVPVFYRGGSIIVRKNKRRLTTFETENDPYTIYICLNYEQEAEGTLYEDDHKTFDYQNGEHLYISIEYFNNTITSSQLNDTTYNRVADITEVVILNPPHDVKEAKVSDDNSEVSVVYTEKHKILTLSNLKLSLTEPFKVKLILENYASALRFNIMLIILVVIKSIFV